jgi:hypothetical protein
MNFLELFTSKYGDVADIEPSVVEEAKHLPPMEGIVVVDVSGSMLLPHGNCDRLHIAAAVAAELKLRGCIVYVSAGNDTDKTHQTKEIKSDGIKFMREITQVSMFELGGGGIYLEKAVKHISHYHVKPKRLIVLTDDQNNYTPTFGKEVLVFNVADYSYEDLRYAIG